MSEFIGILLYLAGHSV